MVYLLAGCAVLLLLLLAGRLITGANPQKLAAVIRKMAGVAALAAAGFLIVRGALPLPIPLAVFGLALRGRGSGVRPRAGSGTESPAAARRDQRRRVWRRTSEAPR